MLKVYTNVGNSASTASRRHRLSKQTLSQFPESILVQVAADWGPYTEDIDSSSEQK